MLGARPLMRFARAFSMPSRADTRPMALRLVQETTWPFFHTETAAGLGARERRRLKGDQGGVLYM